MSEYDKKLRKFQYTESTYLVLPSMYSTSDVYTPSPYSSHHPCALHTTSFHLLVFPICITHTSISLLRYRGFCASHCSSPNPTNPTGRQGIPDMAHGTSINQGEQASFSPTKRTRSRSFHTPLTPDLSHLISPRPVIPSNSTKKEILQILPILLVGDLTTGPHADPRLSPSAYSSFIYIVRKILRNPRPWPG